MPDARYRCFDPTDPPEWLRADVLAEFPNVDHISNWVHQARIQAATDAAVALCEYSAGTTEITDIGTHEAGVLQSLPEPFRSCSWGYEVNRACIEAAVAKGLDVRYADVVNQDVPIAEVIVCTEVLEHLEHPHEFARRLGELGARFAVFSSPHSETVEGHHEWNHAWAWDRPGYRAMLEEAGWRIIDHYDVEWSQFAIAEFGG